MRGLSPLLLSSPVFAAFHTYLFRLGILFLSSMNTNNGLAGLSGRGGQQKHGSSIPPARPYRHKRESSLSTSASVSSTRTRVLPFATAFTTLYPLKPVAAASPIYAQATTMQQDARTSESTDESSIVVPVYMSRTKALTFPNNDATLPDDDDAKNVYFPAMNHSGFALAQPRRVVTVGGMPVVSGGFGRPTSASKDPYTNASGLTIPSKTSLPPVAGGRRALGVGRPAIGVDTRRLTSTSSIGIGTRTKPIIGLGLTLNPDDNVVKLNLKRSVSTQRGAQGSDVGSSSGRRKSVLGKAAGRRTGTLQVMPRIPSGSIARALTPSVAQSRPDSPVRGIASDELTFKSPVLEPEGFASIRSPTLDGEGTVDSTPSVPDSDDRWNTTMAVQELRNLVGDGTVPGTSWSPGAPPQIVSCQLCFESVAVSSKRCQACCPSCNNPLPAGRLNGRVHIRPPPLMLIPN
ncbi:hypothetical protein DL89DRAFT_270729 [Linderina pennispora]|uniref:Uncharacterized protein n=1 Tax=Linderina pennispora TaxID=61395 RepID=A0A1Y1VWK5_9FUNG|nr:uncharacterized protein DL89DRAFT_270729 [Linderina pennispora]ORX65671.1 hypothetical protein DL89DRAFT_270729 [Linderina pennispora]